jgi:hypothetical protein
MKISFPAAVTLIILHVTLSSCTKYYLVHTQSPATPQETARIADSLHRQEKYFVMHVNGKAYAITELAVDTSTLIISGSLTTVPEEHSLYLDPHQNIFGSRRTYHSYEAGILNEVHLYSGDPVNDSSFNISVQSIQKIESLQHDKKKTNTANGLGIAALVVIAVLSVVTVLAGSF